MTKMTQPSPPTHALDFREHGSRFARFEKDPFTALTALKIALRALTKGKGIFMRSIAVVLPGMLCRAGPVFAQTLPTFNSNSMPSRFDQVLDRQKRTFVSDAYAIDGETPIATRDDVTWTERQM
jgi:hypothetical protein